MPELDAIGRILLQRVRELLAARPDLDRRTLGRGIGRTTPSWLSEFLNGRRTTNDLRLVIRMARFLGVPVGFLLNERDPPDDAQTVTMMGAWEELASDDREAVLQLALRLRRRRLPSGK